MTGTMSVLYSIVNVGIPLWEITTLNFGLDFEYFRTRDTSDNQGARGSLADRVWLLPCHSCGGNSSEHVMSF